MAGDLPGIDPCWGLDVLRQRLHGAHIAQSDLQRRYDELADEHGRLSAAYQGLYALLSPEVKAAIVFARQEYAAQSRKRTEAVLHTVRDNTG